MYAIKKAFELPANIELPKSMYSLKPIDNNLNQSASSLNGTSETVVPDTARNGLHGSNSNNILHQKNMNSPNTNGKINKNLGKRKRSRSPAKSKSPVSVNSMNQAKTDTPMDTSEDVINSPKDGSSDQFISNLEARQQEVISKLLRLREMLNNASRSTAVVFPQTNTVAANEIPNSVEAVITVDPAKPPYSVLFLAKLMKENYGSAVTLKSHLHSSCAKPLPGSAKLFDQSTNEDIRGNKITISVIWKQKGAETDPELLVQPTLQSPIRGEANVARYLSRLLSSMNPINYDGLTWDDIIRVDTLLENAADGITELESLDERLKNNKPFLLGEPSIADFVLFSAVTLYVTNHSQQKGKFSHVNDWLIACQELGGFSL